MQCISAAFNALWVCGVLSLAVGCSSSDSDGNSNAAGMTSAGMPASTAGTRAAGGVAAGGAEAGGAAVGGNQAGGAAAGGVAAGGAEAGGAEAGGAAAGGAEAGGAEAGGAAAGGAAAGGAAAGGAAAGGAATGGAAAGGAEAGGAAAGGAEAGGAAAGGAATGGAAAGGAEAGGAPAGGQMGQNPMMGGEARAAIEIAGIWNDNYGGWSVINVNAWGPYILSDYDNDANWAVTQNAADADFAPSQFNYVVWTEPAEDGSWWHCTVAFDIDTLEQARMTLNTADDSDPANGGCGGFAWTQMTPRVQSS